jgi:hypothetical protein
MSAVTEISTATAFFFFRRKEPIRNERNKYNVSLLREQEESGLGVSKEFHIRREELSFEQRRDFYGAGFCTAIPPQRLNQAHPLVAELFNASAVQFCPVNAICQDHRGIACTMMCSTPHS